MMPEMSGAEATKIINNMSGRKADSGYTHALILSPFNASIPQKVMTAVDLHFR